jgi:hypothetical protein
MRAGGMAQVVEYLPSKSKSLNSSPVLPKRKKKFYSFTFEGSIILVYK